MSNSARAGTRLLSMAMALFIGLAAGAATAKELKVAHFMSPKHPMHARVMAPMVEALAKVSDGKLTARIYPAGELGKGPVQQYKRAIDGVADIVFGIPGYTSTQFPRTLLVALPGVTDGPVDATHMMWGAFDTYLNTEFQKVKMLALWANDLAVLITKDKPVHNVADVKGMKIRAPDAIGAKAIEAWGAVPVNMPVDKVYNAFNTGIVDAVYIGASGIGSFKLNEIGKYYTTGMPSVVAAFYLIMNKQSWDALSAEEQGQIEQVTGKELSLIAAETYAGAGQRGLDLAKKSGGEIIELSPEGIAEFRTAGQTVIDAVVAELEAKGIPAGDILGTLEKGKIM